MSQKTLPFGGRRLKEKGNGRFLTNNSHFLMEINRGILK
jgi:hypothetical protein